MAAPRLDFEMQAPAESQPSVDAVDVRRFECDACGEMFAGRPHGAGLFVWTRGAEVRYEEPPLCESCAEQITVGALLKWQLEDEEG